MGKSKEEFLQGNVFSFRNTKDMKVFIYFKNKEARILKGEQAQKFLCDISAASPSEQQLIMAKITGNFKHGNENH
ncbi:MAG TPA: hypothetical protein PKH64_01475 [Petrotogaceae bacterium]|jgi:hypothetical protein|nr:hypothetical protein [Petrotogaceae bacterium]HNV04768.1 hypothetical protein [Petrotogaceae bacterium]HPA94031.1 hypothetical protein [Petrotogaceae bacterium]HQO13396.1 hypothetical protein [Petrotogaceae bacterium]